MPEGVANAPGWARAAGVYRRAASHVTDIDAPERVLARCRVMLGAVSDGLRALCAVVLVLIYAHPAQAEGDAPRRADKTLSTRLENGLEVVLSEARAQPLFSMMVRYRVGGRHEPPHLDELAHLVEHLSFRFSPHAGKQQFLAMAQAGVHSNGYTEDDATTYTNEGPIGALERVLWFERQRMAFTLPSLSSSDVVAERRMLENERFTKRADRTGGLFWHFVGAELYPPHHPYAPREERGCIQRCELRHVQWLMQRGYRPDNARLVVVGDFDASAVLAQVHRLFGSIQNPSVRLPSASPPALRVEPRRITIAAPVPRSRLHLFWEVPKALQSELLTLRILEAEFGLRLSRDLVDGVALATDVDVDLEQRDLGWWWSVNVGLLPGMNPERVEQRILALLALLRTKLMPIESGRASSITGLLDVWDQPHNRAALLTSFDLGFDLAKTIVELSRVSAKDAQLAAQRFLLGKPRLAVHLRRAIDADHRGELYREPQ